MSIRSWFPSTLAVLACAGVASVASAQCATYTVAPGSATFVSGVDDTTNHADDATTNIVLPFSFSLYANAYTSVNVGSNGFLDFTQAHANGFYSNACLPAARGTTDGTGTSFGPVIFAHWDDLRTDGGGQGIFTTTLGSAPNRTFVIEWRAGFYSNCTGTANFEVLLYEGQTFFDVVYADGGSCGGSSATSGVESSGTGPFTQYSCNTAALTGGVSLRYTCIPPTFGACCAASGSCSTTEASGCIGGVYQGVGTSCTPANPCGGACCDESLACTVTTAAGCTGGRVYINQGICAPSPCPIGVCCNNSTGACTSITTGTCPNGTSTVMGISCSPTTCPAIGHCCDNISSACSLLYGGFCSVNASFDPSPTCTPAPCPQVAWACCLADTSCIALFQNDCGTRGGVWQPGSTCGAFICSGSPNLIQNPGAETGDYSSWTITANGGGDPACGCGDVTGWSIANDSPVHSGNRSFNTSYVLDERNQVVDLLAAGFSAAQLDAAPPIVMGEWVGSRFDQGARYYVRFDLLAADQTTVIATFESGNAAALNQIPAGTMFFQVANTFTGYGAGVRYLRFADGGRDVAGWSGHYGAHFDDAFASVVVTSACCTGAACSLVSNADCITAGGTPAAAGSTCAVNPCGGPSGVCCRGATCTSTVTTTAACSGSLISGQQAGAAFVTGACGAGPISSSPCCFANYDKANGIQVADIFAFLNDWFASSPFANTGGSGSAGPLSVQNIFDFLSNWFNGGCS